MKILGKCDNGFICEVSKYELGNVFNKYSISDISDINFEVGKEVDLSLGYDFRDDIKSMCNQMVSAYESFNSRGEALFKLAKLIQSAIPGAAGNSGQQAAGQP